MDLKRCLKDKGDMGLKQCREGQLGNCKEAFKQIQMKNLIIQSYKMQLKPDAEDNGVISKAFLKKLCKSDFRNYYSTPYLNDILYLHYKGFNQIANLEEFTGLKVIYLEGNAIKRIQGLQLLTNLRCLYLQENLIGNISGLDTLSELSNLNLSDNLIEKVTGLSKLTKLSNLQLKRNRIGTFGLQDVNGLLECPSISALDISDNKIQTEEFVPEILLKLPNIAVVYMQNNEFTKKISHYRKSIISKMPHIKYIDDKPVFEDEKRFAEAWARGGLEEQRKQRALYKKEKEDEQLKQHQQFRKMIERAREQGRKERQNAQSSQSESESHSRNQSLQTYKSPEDSKENSEEHSAKLAESESEKAESEKGDSVKQTKEVKSERQPSQKSNSQKSEPKDMGIAYLDELD